MGEPILPALYVCEVAIAVGVRCHCVDMPHEATFHVMMFKGSAALAREHWINYSQRVVCARQLAVTCERATRGEL